MITDEKYKTFYEVHYITDEDEVLFKEFDTLDEAKTFQKKQQSKGYETILQEV